MITMGYNINDIVAFMTSPVATFIDILTEENIFNHWKMSPETAASFLTKGLFEKGGGLKKYYLETYGTFKMQQILDLMNRLGLLDSEDTFADTTEFLNILEGANEFSNFGRLLGANQGIKTTKVDLQKFENTFKRMFSDRYEKADLTDDQRLQFRAFGELDVKKWFSNANYRKKVSDMYNQIKKCINIFEIFEHIEQFDAIRQLYDFTFTAENDATIKSKSFNTIISKVISENPYITEQYQKNLLREIDGAFINKFIQDQNYTIPMPRDAKVLTGEGALINSNSDSLKLNNRASIASFKYLMESKIVPDLKNGIIYTLDKDDNPKTITNSSLLSNLFIQSLRTGEDGGIDLLQSDIDMNLIDKSLITQKKYQKYSYALQELGNVQVTEDLTLADLFQLYNLIVNKNRYGSKRLSTLFSKIVSSDSSAIINKYYQYLGELDYEGTVRFDFESDLNDNPNTLVLNYKDLLVQAAPFVKTTKGQQDPYVYTIENGIMTLFKKEGKIYLPVNEYMPRYSGESDDDYQERLINEKNYFVLGGRLSDILIQKLEVIRKLKDTDKILSYLRDFTRRGLLDIQKSCE